MCSFCLLYYHKPNKRLLLKVDSRKLRRVVVIVVGGHGEGRAAIYPGEQVGHTLLLLGSPDSRTLQAHALQAHVSYSVRQGGGR
jgi:hypothetical protein